MKSEQRTDGSSDSGGGSDGKRKRLVERLSEAIRSRHYSRRTEKAYWYWIRYFIRFHGRRHPAQMGAAEVTAFLSWLATERNVAAATQNQALSALLFLYKHVLGMDLPWLGDLVRAQRPVRLPTVLSEGEVRRLLACVPERARLMVGLLYGAGLRQIECLSLRVKDIDFAYRQILVRYGKGARDRVTMLPGSLVQPLQEHLGKVRWQYVFPSANRSTDPEDGSHASPPRASRYAEPRGQPRGPARRDREAGELPHLAPFVRDAPP